MTINGVVHVLLGVAVLALVGCAQPVKRQAFDTEVSSRIHTVLIAQAPNQESFETAVIDHPGASFGLIGGLVAAADIQSKTNRVTTAVDTIQTRLQDRFSEMLREGLNAQGYEARIVVLPGSGEPDQFLPFLRQQGQADAALVVLVNGRYWAAGPTTDYFPFVSAKTKGYELGSGTVLYEDTFTYGYTDQQQSETVHFASDPKYRFASVDQMVADPARVRDGWVAGLRLIADQILADVKRKK